MRYYCILILFFGLLNHLSGQKDYPNYLVELNQGNSSYQSVKDSNEVVFIKFKIRNNSAGIHSYYVKGPNGRGGNFSYGFKMFPFGIREENWSIGTKVYKQSQWGKLTELIVVTESSEGKTLDLYK